MRPSPDAIFCERRASPAARHCRGHRCAGTAPAADKDELAELALARATRLGATYADIRINRYRDEEISAREQRVQALARSQSYGFGVRVLVNGAWGFAASPDVRPAAVERVTDQAIEIAKANSAYQRKPIELVPTPKVSATWRSAFEQDPFEVATDRKIEFLLAMNEAAMKAKGASFVKSSLSFQNEQKFFASTDGTRIEQYIIRTHPTLTVTAVNRKAGDFQTRRSLPGPKCIGYEYLETISLAEGGRAGRGGSGGETGRETGRAGEIRPRAASVASLSDDSRIGRPLDRARSRLGVGSRFRRHQLS